MQSLLETAMDQMVVSHWNSNVEALIPNVRALETGR